MNPLIELIRSILGNPTAHTLTSFTAKWGNTAQSLAALLGAQADARSTTPGAGVTFISWLKGLFAAWLSEVAVRNISLAAIDTTLTTNPTGSNVPDAANTLLNIQALAGSYYTLRDFRLRVTSFGTGTWIDITIWLMENGTMYAAQTVRIGASGSFALGSRLSLTDLYGEPTITGEAIAITATTDVGSTGALRGSAYVDVARTS